ncbi:hypothetical protein DERP_001576 [Dermatophagoides pteronyssinus]|uniref:Uncharacterized protein n=1 Tax=Dermatophagoides pteronyssinus TaxID=6956 RepID=A0ABQ8JBE2_DERPT|nr:hypothetical protein DERP_001576 [Dermatophagoides pteronyssinus]
MVDFIVPFVDLDGSVVDVDDAKDDVNIESNNSSLVFFCSCCITGVSDTPIRCANGMYSSSLSESITIILFVVVAISSTLSIGLSWLDNFSTLLAILFFLFIIKFVFRNKSESILGTIRSPSGDGL